MKEVLSLVDLQTCWKGSLVLPLRCPGVDVVSVKKVKEPRDCGPRELPYLCLYPVMVGGQRKFKRKKFRTRKAAEEFDRKAHEALEVVGNVDRSRAEKMTVGQLHREYMTHLARRGGRDREGIAETTLHRYENVYAASIKPSWHGSPLSTLTDTATRAWMDSFGFSTPTQKRLAVKQLSRMLEFATGKYVTTNTVKPLVAELPREVRVEKVTITPRQVFRLAACTPAHHSDIFMFLALTGLRFGELAALKRRDIRGNMLTVRRTQREDNGRIWLVESTKSGEHRSIPLAPRAKAIVDARAEGKGLDGLLFVGGRGAPLRNSNFTIQVLRPAVALGSSAVQRLHEALGILEHEGDHHSFGKETVAAVERVQCEHGLPVSGAADPATRRVIGLEDHACLYTLQRGDEDFIRDFTFHNFRHTAVSLAVSAGAKIMLVSKFAGHAKASMTLDVYSHLFDDDLSGVAERLEDLFLKAQEPVGSLGA